MSLLVCVRVRCTVLVTRPKLLLLRFGCEGFRDDDDVGSDAGPGRPAAVGPPTRRCEKVEGIVDQYHAQSPRTGGTRDDSAATPP